VRLDSPSRLDRLNAGLAAAGTSLLQTFMAPADAERFAAAGFRGPSADRRVPIRNPDVKGPLPPGGDWLASKGITGPLAIARLDDSDDVTYEIANFIDGVRTVGEIRDAVSAEFAPVALSAVAEYLDALAKAGAVSFKP